MNEICLVCTDLYRMEVNSAWSTEEQANVRRQQLEDAGEYQPFIIGAPFDEPDHGKPAHVLHATLDVKGRPDKHSRGEIIGQGTTGEKQGIGASRSQGFGTYAVTRWDRLQ